MYYINTKYLLSLVSIIPPEALGLTCFFALPARLSFVVVFADEFSQVLGIFSLYFRPVFNELGVDGAQVLPAPGDVRHHLRVPEASGA